MNNCVLNAEKNFLDDTDELSSIAEQVALGPQEEVITLINQLNQQFSVDFKCTPSFRWQPGFYKKLTKESSRISAFSIQKNKISTYRNKIAQGKWQIDRFLQNVQSIDNKLYYLRNNGSVFQDNTEEVDRVLDDFREKINQTLILTEEIYNNVDIKVYHGLKDFGNRNVRERNNTKHAVTYHIKIKDVSTSINIGGNAIAIPMGDIQLIISVDLVKNVMNRIRGYDRISRGHESRGHTSTWNGAIFEPYEEYIRFPYISERSWNNGLNVKFNHLCPRQFYNVCFGDFNEEIIEAAWAGDTAALILFIKRWTETFNVGTTGPLNSFDKMFFGIWPEMDNDQWRASNLRYGPQRSENCEYGTTLLDNGCVDKAEDSYCVKNQCILKDQCNHFLSKFTQRVEEPLVVDLDVSEDNISEEQLAHEQELINQLQRTNRIRS
mgnify:CR=1 FL=1